MSDVIYSQPGATFTAITDAFATGLTGTLGIRIENTDGTTHTARATTGAVEVEALSGVYTKANLVAPDDAGVYVLLWDDGSGTFDSQRLEVTSTAPAAVTPSGADLTTLDAVKELLETVATNRDDLIQRTITRMSTRMRQYASREFTQTDAEVRSFSYYGGGSLFFGALNDLRTSTLVEFTPYGGVASTIPVEQYLLRPLPARHGVYTQILLPYHAIVYARPAVLSITGDWGFPSVPDDVEEACAIAVKERIQRDVAGFSSTFPDDEAVSAQRPISLPKAVRDVLDDYKLPLVA